MSAHQNHVPDVAIWAGGGVTGWAWLAENHDQITAICAMVGAVGVLYGLAVKIAPHICRLVRWVRSH